MRVHPIDFITKDIIHDSIDRIDKLARYASVHVRSLNNEIVEYETDLSFKCDIANGIISKEITPNAEIYDNLENAYDKIGCYHRLIVNKQQLIEVAKTDLNRIRMNLNKAIEFNDSMLYGRFKPCEECAVEKYKALYDVLDRYYKTLHDDWLLYQHFKQLFKTAIIICQKRS